MSSSIQGFVQLASGLGEMTKARATEAATEILTLTTKAPHAGKKLAKQATAMAEGLLEAAEANRQQLVTLVRTEIDGAVSKLGLGTLAHEVATLSGNVQLLFAQLDELRSGGSGATPSAVKSPAAAPTEAAGAAPKPSASKSAAPTKRGPRKSMAEGSKSASARAKKAPAKKAAPAKGASAAKKASPGKQATPAKKAAPAKKASAAKQAVPAKKAPAKKASAAKQAAAEGASS